VCIYRLYDAGFNSYYAPAQGALSDAVVCRLSRTSGRQAACAAGRLDGAFWLIGLGRPGSRLPVRASVAGAYRGGRPPTGYSLLEYCNTRVSMQCMQIAILLYNFCPSVCLSVCLTNVVMMSKGMDTSSLFDGLVWTSL